ncbi:putative transposase domain protein [Mycobacterium sp. MAC_080597_8934]|nr:putative transposase domain protein [Mycobacterium sp. MAC_080597_8934]
MCTSRWAVGCLRGLCAHGEDILGAMAVQVVWSSRRGSRRIEHLGSAHDEAGWPL